ncbi:hypothetical protein ACOME3_009268 [Neoechinorhynchus agilis]
MKLFERSKRHKDICSLREILLGYAHEWYKRNDKKYVKCRYGRKLSKWTNLVKEIDWSGLRVKHEELKPFEKETNLSTKMSCTQRSNCQLPSSNRIKKQQHVLYRSRFVNDTNNDQSYNLKAERRTVARCKISLIEGYKAEVGSNAALSVPLPNCVLKMSANLKTEYSLEDRIERDIEEELRWSAESVVKVPSMSVTTAELIVDEDEYDGDFTIRSSFTGEIKVLLKHSKTGMTLLEMRFTDLADVFTVQDGFQPIENTQGVAMVSRGHCSIHFGIDQKIELHQRPIPTMQ